MDYNDYGRKQSSKIERGSNFMQKSIFIDLGTFSFLAFSKV
jgi:hypothetical protein